MFPLSTFQFSIYLIIPYFLIACDVVSSEPMKENNPLKSAPNCIVTPHMAWAPVESRQRIADCTERSIRAFLSGKPVNTVNL